MRELLYVASIMLLGSVVAVSALRPATLDLPAAQTARPALPTDFSVTPPTR